jgi:hypothetical protein
VIQPYFNVSPPLSTIRVWVGGSERGTEALLAAVVTDELAVLPFVAADFLDATDAGFFFLVAAAAEGAEDEDFGVAARFRFVPEDDDGDDALFLDSSAVIFSIWGWKLILLACAVG